MCGSCLLQAHGLFFLWISLYQRSCVFCPDGGHSFLASTHLGTSEPIRSASVTRNLQGSERVERSNHACDRDCCRRILLLCQARARGEAVCSRRHGRPWNRECNAMVQTHRKVEGPRRAVSPFCPHAAGSITFPHAVPLFHAPKRKAEWRCASSCSKLFQAGSLPSRCNFSARGVSNSASALHPDPRCPLSRTLRLKGRI